MVPLIVTPAMFLQRDYNVRVSMFYTTNCNYSNIFVLHTRLFVGTRPGNKGSLLWVSRDPGGINSSLSVGHKSHSNESVGFASLVDRPMLWPVTGCVYGYGGRGISLGVSVSMPVPVPRSPFSFYTKSRSLPLPAYFASAFSKTYPPRFFFVALTLGASLVLFPCCPTNSWSSRESARCSTNCVGRYSPSSA